MKTPDWLKEVLDEQVAQATDRVIASNTQEELWTAKGRLDGVKRVQSEIEIALTALELEDKERREGTFAHV